MKSVTIAALTALLSTGALAVPTPGHVHGHGHRHAGRHADMHLNRRDIVWITEFEVETVTVMKTVYGDGSEPTDAPDTLSAAETPAPVTFTSYAAKTTSHAPAPVTTSATPAAYTSSSSSSSTTTTTTSTTTQAPAPAPVTTQSSSYVAPAPAPQTTSSASSSAYQAPAPSSSAPASPPSYGGGACTASSDELATTSGSCHSGDFTWYDVGMGACGITNVETDAIVAIAESLFDKYTPGGNPNANTLCGRKVNLYNKDGTSFSATVTDRCVGCAVTDLDLSKSLFNTVTNNGDGRVHGMAWDWA